MPSEEALDVVLQYIARQVEIGNKTFMLKPRKVVNYVKRVLGTPAIGGVGHGVYKSVAEAIKLVCRDAVGVESTKCVLTLNDAIKVLEEYRGGNKQVMRRVRSDPVRELMKAVEEGFKF